MVVVTVQQVIIDIGELQAAPGELDVKLMVITILQMRDMTVPRAVVTTARASLQQQASPLKTVKQQ